MRVSSPTAAGVVLASGAGTRVGSATNKVFLPVAGRRVVSWAMEAMARPAEVGVLVLVVRPQDHEHVEWVLDRELDHLEIEIVHGGQTRQESELHALRHLAARIDDGTIDTVLIHDAARPAPSPSLIAGVVHAAREHGGAIPGVRDDSLRMVNEDGSRLEGQTPAGLIRVQTPQGFRARPLLDAYEKAAREEFVGTDTASCMENFSDLPVQWIAGEGTNIKITYPDDLVLAEQLLTELNSHD
ncbi:2-C-methyl-D-erythritol 4-phosphate cytidylyltransferase [Saccharopolyspora erythraea]|uniref:IspD/TarI family cytidylyltransferase n=1 Tax=Saccharopolyspora erythraea TaxID=1836 RepID=UPI001BAC199A|nr:IspD/TarI family cytidylyltransferase [Saccharopolyspora erythraea]QUH04129.1 2-C-methyl-D-erythritol 4-phosphate cytidylyltransferase [Saccharopolyspora erythraea]